MSVNSVNISGRIGHEPEVRATQVGTQVLSFSVAVDERVKNRQTGEYESKPNWIDVTVFGNYAEAMARVLEKGMKVAVSGRLRQSSWETDDGQKRSKIEVIASTIEFLSRHEADSAPQQEAPVGYTQADVQASYLPPRDPQTGGYGPTPAPFYQPVEQGQPTLMPQGDYYRPQPQAAPPRPPQQDVFSEDIPF